MGSFFRYVGVAAWAWLIIVGAAILITPNGPVCTACGQDSDLWLGVVSVVLGLGGFATLLGARAPQE